MYVRIYSQVKLLRPPASSTRVVLGPPGGSLNRPPERARRKHGCPSAAWSAVGGHVCIYIYILSESLSGVLLLLSIVDFFLSAMLSERESIPVISCQPSLALLLLPSACCAAAASAAPLAPTVANCLSLLCPLVCTESTSHSTTTRYNIT